MKAETNHWLVYSSTLMARIAWMKTGSSGALSPPGVRLLKAANPRLPSADLK